MQDALVSTFGGRARFRSVEQAEQYVRRAIVSRFIDGTRHDSVEHAALERALARVPTAVEDRADAGASRRARAALARLSPRQRACVVLRHVDDLSVRETATLLGLSEGAVKRYVADGVGPRSTRCSARRAAPATTNPSAWSPPRRCAMTRDLSDLMADRPRRAGARDRGDRPAARGVRPDGPTRPAPPPGPALGRAVRGGRGPSRDWPTAGWIRLPVRTAAPLRTRRRRRSESPTPTPFPPTTATPTPVTLPGLPPVLPLPDGLLATDDARLGAHHLPAGVRREGAVAGQYVVLVSPQGEQYLVAGPVDDGRGPDPVVAGRVALDRPGAGRRCPPATLLVLGAPG